jgi:hypothetical protein
MGNMEKYINICRMSFVAENGLAHLCVCVIRVAVLVHVFAVSSWPYCCC